MITWICLGVAAYLLIGCLTMLIANDLLDGALTNGEFLRGMLIWPIGAVSFLWFFFSTVIARLNG